MGKTAKISYYLSEAGRKDSLLKGGDGKQVQVLEVPVTEKILKFARVESTGDVTLEIGNGVTIEVKLSKGYGGARPNWEEKKYYYYAFDAVQTAESLLKWEEDRVSRIAAYKAEHQKDLDRLLKEYEAAEEKRQQEKLRREEEEKIAREKRIADEKSAQEQREAEKAAWIETHGSDFLKRAVHLGYDCQRRYATERAALDLPGFAVDFDDNAGWKSRSCPTEAALDEVEALIQNGHKAEVVWLTSPTNDVNTDYKEYFEPCEAVVVRKFLGKYDVVKTI